MPRDRHPPGSGPPSVTRRRVLQALAAGATLGASTTAYGYAVERHQVDEHEQSVPVAGLPPALEGLRIGLLTDLHCSPSVPDSLIQAAVEAVTRAGPDLIVLGGDYVTRREPGYRKHAERVAGYVAGLEAPYGVFAVLGNHDREPTVPRALLRNRIQVLADTRVTLHVRGELLDLIGIRFRTRRLCEIAAIAAGAKGLPILLAHDPRRLTQAEELGIPLVLSGHTHGGQIVLPVLGAIAAHDSPTAAGLLVRGRTSLYVSRGIGTIYVPCRINCPPEAPVLRLRPASA